MHSPWCWLLLWQLHSQLAFLKLFSCPIREVVKAQGVGMFFFGVLSHDVIIILREGFEAHILLVWILVLLTKILAAFLWIDATARFTIAYRAFLTSKKNEAKVHLLGIYDAALDPLGNFLLDGTHWGYPFGPGKEHVNPFPSHTSQRLAWHLALFPQWSQWAICYKRSNDTVSWSTTASWKIDGLAPGFAQIAFEPKLRNHQRVQSIESSWNSKLE